MIKLIYTLRVFLVSFEFVFILLYLTFKNDAAYFITEAMAQHKVNDDAYEYLMLVPVAVFIWMVNEVTPILFPSESINMLLHKWEGIWKLKLHVYVGLFYSFLSFSTCLLVWLLSDDSTPQNMVTLATAIVIQAISAMSFLSAKIEMSSISARNSGP
ncbi:hypothetical protein [Aeromonas hydrophila]|uniref:hypothetical protein n=2 Tax=Aeromonadaceae TaxID=84642 RepID=UPI0010723ED9|nr:hypothetical protein [Aeromonas hydrophila]HDX8372262.1 hypothetical protein [Aeromonas dhakensis]EGX6959885.1 hypothetical protein [Aeromonas hydrophila]MCA4701412.1 hypothetical protein [Aeromonas hydrophila]MCO4224014.1 hypothetical protein [Aeromonas hydrophila]QIO20512.1 hypothetical protein G9455_22765 [Aeromonas hydrophila]